MSSARMAVPGQQNISARISPHAPAPRHGHTPAEGREPRFTSEAGTSKGRVIESLLRGGRRVAYIFIVPVPNIPSSRALNRQGKPGTILLLIARTAPGP